MRQRSGHEFVFRREDMGSRPAPSSPGLRERSGPLRGAGCADADFYGIYADVSANLEFITCVMDAHCTFVGNATCDDSDASSPAEGVGKVVDVAYKFGCNAGSVCVDGRTVGRGGVAVWDVALSCSAELAVRG